MYKIVLLIDRNGSMTPFHGVTERFTWHIESMSFGLILYFQNIVGKTLFKDKYLMEPIAREEILTQCDRETRIGIVSDAGAARGYRKLERIQATTTFLSKLKERTELIEWHNPMPEERWLGSSAEVIQHMVKMIPMEIKSL